MKGDTKEDIITVNRDEVFSIFNLFNFISESEYWILRAYCDFLSTGNC